MKNTNKNFKLVGKWKYIFLNLFFKTAIIAIALTLTGFYALQATTTAKSYWNSILIDYRLPVKIALQSPIIIETKIELNGRFQKLNTSELTETLQLLKYFPSPYRLSLIEKEICLTFKTQCINALNVSHGENGTRQCDRIGYNNNRTIDLGLFQINSIHLNKNWKLSDLIDCHKNIQYAYQIYSKQGWTPWVAAKKLNIK